MRPQVPVGPLTYDDVQQFPDDGLRYELVDGELLVSPSPGIAHQRCVTRLVGLLLAAARASRPETGQAGTGSGTRRAMAATER